MSEQLKKVSVAKDLLAFVGVKLKESQVILITLGGLGLAYSSFVTTITTWCDHAMRFSTLKQLLLDFEMTLPIESRESSIEAHTAFKSNKTHP